METIAPGGVEQLRRLPALTDDLLGDWERHCAILSQEAPSWELAQLLLYGFGFARRDVARVADVTAAGLREIRAGDVPVKAWAHWGLAGLLAACDVIELLGVADEPAAWLEGRVEASAPVTFLDLFIAGRRDLLFAATGRRLSGAEVLDAFKPDWRERYRSDFEVLRAADGELDIRPKA